MNLSGSDSGPGIVAGKRLAVCGRAGTGKTTLQKWFVLRSKLRWAIMDTKHDPGFDGWGAMRGGLPTMRDLGRAWRDRQFVVIRPLPSETTPEVLDAYLGELHDSFENFGTLIDETYHFALGSNPGAGLTGLVTRGRARGQAVILGMQRPSKVPLFVLSEANAHAVLPLTMDADRKRMVELTGHAAFLERGTPRHWLYYDIDKGELRRYAPVTIRK